MASKESSIGKGDNAEGAARNWLKKVGYATIKAPRTANPYKQGKRTFNQFHYDQVDFFHAFDIEAARDNSLLLIQVTTPGNTKNHQNNIDKAFPFNFENTVRIELWLWEKVKAGTQDRYIFHILRREPHPKYGSVWVLRETVGYGYPIPEIYQ